MASPSNVDSRLALAATLGIGGAFLAGAAAYEWKRRQMHRIPSENEWRKVGEVTNLYCYPIKSCGSITLPSFEATDMGVKSDKLRDRVLVVVDRTGKFVTARTHYRLPLVTPSLDGEVLTLSLKDDKMDIGTVSVDLSVLRGRPTQRVKVWTDYVRGVDCGDAAAAWIRKAVLEKCHGEATAEADLRLMFFPQDHSERKGIRGDTGALSDKCAFLMLNEASLGDLNHRLDKPVTAKHFRPNFIIKGPAPFEEDNWTWVRIGDAVFHVVQPCTRCVLTTVDPETGVKAPSMEPLKTLNGYRKPQGEFRKFGSSPMMGALMGLRQQGEVSIGDPVFVSP